MHVYVHIHIHVFIYTFIYIYIMPIDDANHVLPCVSICVCVIVSKMNHRDTYYEWVDYFDYSHTALIMNTQYTTIAAPKQKSKSS